MFAFPPNSIFRRPDVIEGIVAFIIAWVLVCAGVVFFCWHNFPTSM